MTTLEELKLQYAAKYREICEMISATLGLGAFGSLSEQDQLHVVEEVQEATAAWMDAHNHNRHLEPKAPLQILLAEHLKISEKILNFDDRE